MIILWFFDKELIAKFSYILSDYFSDTEKIDILDGGGVYITVGEFRLLLRAIATLQENYSLQRRVKLLTEEYRLPYMERSQMITVLTNEIGILQATIVTHIDKIVKLGIKHRDTEKVQFLQLLHLFEKTVSGHLANIAEYFRVELRLMIDNARDILTNGNAERIAARLRENLKFNQAYINRLKEVKAKMSELENAFKKLLDECRQS